MAASLADTGVNRDQLGFREFTFCLQTGSLVIQIDLLK